jgi:hypothetical protein
VRLIRVDAVELRVGAAKERRLQVGVAAAPEDVAGGRPLGEALSRPLTPAI